jgi:hypothetical protein
VVDNATTPKALPRLTFANLVRLNEMRHALKLARLQKAIDDAKAKK